MKNDVPMQECMLVNWKNVGVGAGRRVPCLGDLKTAVAHEYRNRSADFCDRIERSKECAGNLKMGEALLAIE